jgi:outer membrane protein assembly factor BamA
MLLVGGKHSERELRSVIELNLRPLYEERGYLTVAFPSVKLVGSTAAVQVVESALWTLGRVSLNGDTLPTEPMLKPGAFAEGKPANWKLLLECITKMEKVLRRDGYLAVASRPVRQFHDSGQIVDVRIDVRKGRQSFFGSVEFHGLTPADEEIARPLWKLAAGAPMDEPYIDDFWREVYKALNGSAKSIKSQMHPHPDSNIVDVVLLFQ